MTEVPSTTEGLLLARRTLRRVAALASWSTISLDGLHEVQTRVEEALESLVGNGLFNSLAHVSTEQALGIFRRGWASEMARRQRTHEPDLALKTYIDEISARTEDLGRQVQQALAEDEDEPEATAQSS